MLGSALVRWGGSGSKKSGELIRGGGVQRKGLPPNGGEGSLSVKGVLTVGGKWVIDQMKTEGEAQSREEG